MPASRGSAHGAGKRPGRSRLLAEVTNDEPSTYVVYIYRMNLVLLIRPLERVLRAFLADPFVGHFASTARTCSPRSAPPWPALPGTPVPAIAPACMNDFGT